MQNELEQLKQNSVGKVKAYNEPVDKSQLALIGDFVCSYVIEDGLMKQGVLTISHKDRTDFKVPDDFKASIKNVFGEQSIIFHQTYPNRGRCTQYVFHEKI
jgi:hypothetical protein